MADNNNNSMPAISLNDLINVARLNYFFNRWMNDARVARVFKGPKGDKGDKGDKGERGPQGVKGDTGYEIHLEDMTEAEKQELKELLEDGLVFASKETCREIVDELD